MSVEQQSVRSAAVRLAAAARSILACPAEVQLVVDGIDDVTAGLDDGAGLTLHDSEGRPMFSCPSDSALARAAMERRGAVLTLTSGVGRPGSPQRDALLTVSGRLELTGPEDCECCGESRSVVTVHPDFVMLTRGGDDTRFRVPLAAFGSSDHELNSGFCQRSTEHANLSHQAELRRAVAATTDTRYTEIIGVQLSGLHAEGVTIEWVDTVGAHRRTLDFERPARSTAELGELLRSHLHAGLC